jgi:ATP-dependent Clp protease protease subunit
MKFWEFKAKKDDSKTGELMLYGEISNYTWWGDEITPKEFKKDLDGLGDIENLNIFINSGGGDVFAGQSIYSMLKRHKAYKTVYIDGLAASIASVVAMAGNRVVMPKNAMLMIHKAWSIGIGNANDMRKLADDLDKIDESIEAVYLDKTGKKVEEIRSLMTDESWFTADEALKNKFIDEIEEEKKIAASINEDFLTLNNLNFELKKFKNKPKIEEFTPKIDEKASKNSSKTPQRGLVDVYKLKSKNLKGEQL